MSNVRRGKQFERDAVKRLRGPYPGARRRLQYQPGHDVPDVQAGPLWVECKAGKVNVGTVYALTAARAAGRAVPAVVSKAPGRTGPMLITLSLADFARLVRR